EPDRQGMYDWWTDFERAEGPVYDFLLEQREAGRIRWLGLGGTTVYEMARLIRTGKFDVVLTAFNYSLLWRESGDWVIPAAAEQGMGIVVGSPLQQGALALRRDEEIEHGAVWMSPPRRAQYRALYACLDEIGLSLPEAGLRFVLSNPAVSCTLMGARSAAEVEYNVAAVERGPLPAEVLARFDEIAAMVPFRPYEEPLGLPFGGGYHGPPKYR
ncbi:MAG: aldo/keto reductase, partial [Armatimonadetes bacterium]|nr:aldo/keto reductase [Armatimonadota bacterium]